MACIHALLLATAIAIAPIALAQPVPPATALSPPAAVDARPTSEEKRCKASRRRVERQLEVIAQAQARADREKSARAACKTKRSCDSLDRSVKASQVRGERHAKQLRTFEAEAAKACTAAQRPPG